MTVADRIKQRRIELGLSQDELAKKMGYSSKSAISRTENSGDDIGANRVRNFAKALMTSESYLMGWTEQNPSGPKFEPDHLYIIDMYSRLTDSQKQIVLNTMKAFLNKD